MTSQVYLGAIALKFQIRIRIMFVWIGIILKNNLKHDKGKVVQPRSAIAAVNNNVEKK